MKQEPLLPIRPISRLKEDAKALKKELGISQTKALNQIAQREGFSSWQFLVTAKITKPSYPLINEDLIRHNRELLAKLSLDHSELIITSTGIEKSIMDAVAPLRDFFQIQSLS